MRKHIIFILLCLINCIYLKANLSEKKRIYATFGGNTNLNWNKSIVSKGIQALSPEVTEFKINLGGGVFVSKSIFSELELGIMKNRRNVIGSSADIKVGYTKNISKKIYYMVTPYCGVMKGKEVFSNKNFNKIGNIYFGLGLGIGIPLLKRFSIQFRLLGQYENYISELNSSKFHIEEHRLNILPQFKLAYNFYQNEK